MQTGFFLVLSLISLSVFALGHQEKEKKRMQSLHQCELSQEVRHLMLLNPRPLSVLPNLFLRSSVVPSSLSSLCLLNVLLLSQIGFLWIKLFSCLLTRSLSEFYYNLSTSQTCNISATLVPTLLLPLHSGFATWFFNFLFLVLNPPFSLSLQSQILRTIFSSLFSIHPSSKLLLKFPAEVNFCYSDHVNFHFLQALPDLLSLFAEVT